jgi:hypothetical protein
METRILASSKWQHTRTQRKQCVHDRYFVTCVWQARLTQGAEQSLQHMN